VNRVQAGEEFWALRNVSFEVEQGHVLGILGRNGAGKSTLLKLLSRITQPTTGRARLRGRLGSLLEVGTGFNPELSGRDNVFLNGAILGMRRTEIARKFDAIVAFSEIEQFIDTPVKRYSSGMTARLAFAVAAHLEPDILIVDEVLSVGDATFQKKSMEKIDELVHKEHRTVLLVSHSPAAISSLCDCALFLHGGRTAYFGDTETAVRLYKNSANFFLDAMGVLHLPELRWTADGLVPPEHVTTSEEFSLRRTYQVLEAPMVSDFKIAYYAARSSSTGREEALLLGMEEVTSSADKTLGIHTGQSPTLRIGRPGLQYVTAVLESDLPSQDQAQNVTRSMQPVSVNGLTDIVVDNEYPGFSTSGGVWTHYKGECYAGSLLFTHWCSGTTTATWHVSGLPPGVYEVQVTWMPHPNRSSAAPYFIYDAETLLGSARVDQKKIPQGARCDGFPFQSLGQVSTQSGVLKVVLTDAPDGYVIADAVRFVGLSSDS
jgi:ABC-type polysaccharide/polyol phosphate transport system ATPase subunit